jgi:uridine kinase
MKSDSIIGIVGPCSAGKTTLINNLAKIGIHAKHIAQEHSFVKDMWSRIGHADILLYLDVTYKESMRRRPLNMSLKEFQEQDQRLEHARNHADLYIDTTTLSPKEVLDQVVIFLNLC